MDSMSLGSMPAMELVRRPSTTYSGLEEPLEEIPRTWMLGAAPGRAELEKTCTPAVFPWRALSGEVMVRFWMSSDFTCEMEPVTSDFFWTP